MSRVHRRNPRHGRRRRARARSVAAAAQRYKNSYQEAAARGDIPAMHRAVNGYVRVFELLMMGKERLP